MVFFLPMALAQASRWELSSRVDLLEQPGHVSAKGFHRVQALFVLLDLALGPADADVPVARAWDDHLADQEEVVD